MTWNPKPQPFGARLIVVGGQCSKVGKTALIVDLIRAFPDLVWTAVKLTPHAESGCPVNGAACGCKAVEHTFAVREESNAAGTTDTSRFLAAGARRAIWVETKEGRVADALGEVIAHSGRRADPIVIESNAVAEFWHPDLFLMVLDPRRPDFKRSAREALDLADAFVFRSAISVAGQPDRETHALPQKPTFVQFLGQPLPHDLQTFAEQRIGRRQPNVEPN